LTLGFFSVGFRCTSTARRHS